jgi:hypothetical protein
MASLFLTFMQFLVHFFAHLHVRQWYFKDLVLNATISSFEAILIWLETNDQESKKVAINSSTIHFDLENFLILTPSLSMGLSSALPFFMV